MSILRTLPFSLCESGPEEIDCVGNYYLQVLAPNPSQLPLSTLYFLDSHGQVPNKIFSPDYSPITESQIDWFVNTSQALRSARVENNIDKGYHLSLAFLHIPLPEFGPPSQSIQRSSDRTNREPQRQFPFLRRFGQGKNISIRLRA